MGGGVITDVVTGITGSGVYVQGIYLDITNNLLYWSQTATGATDKIRRINISGALPKLSSAATDLITGISNVRGMTLDTISNTIYFADAGTLAQGKGIYRASLATFPVTEAASTKIASTPTGGGFTPQPNTLLLDRLNNFIYWSDYANPGGRIQRASTTAGSYPVAPTVVYSGTSVRGISIDQTLNILYWIEPINLKIRKGSLAVVPITVPIDVVTGLTYFPRNLVFGSSTNPLPVSFTLFNSLCSAGKVTLTWKTAQEFNTKIFVAEKSTDDINWQVVTTINAAGNSTTERTYSITDNNATAKAIYRITSIDIDGRSSTSNIIKASCSAGSGFFSVFPNPVKDVTMITINVDHATALRLKIYDAKGALVKNMLQSLPQGYSQFNIDLSSFAKGAYNLKAFWDNSSKTIQLLKQ